MKTDYAALVHDDRIHGSVYVDAGIFEEEMDRIFHRGWIFAGHESEVPAPGDWVTRRLGLEHYILVRGRDGNINLVANRCSHRGTALCWEERGQNNTFRCTYHGWTYDLDGTLKGVPYPGGFERDKAELGLDRPGQTDSYRGFVFANLSGGAGPLAAHLGAGGTYLIDRLCDLSPTGQIRLAPNWIGQTIESNWKMWPESDNDGYHLNFVHASLVQALPDNQYEETMLNGETGHSSKAVAHEGGHMELDLKASYPAQLTWLNTTPEKVPEYCEAMAEAHGAERANQLLWDGPPHGLIFPNLFLGEGNVALIEPVAPGVTWHHHTAVQLEGAGERVNRRLLRNSEGALGPASFLLADDAITVERIQRGLTGTHPGMAQLPAGPAWIDISRGRGRETVEASGKRVGLLSDETPNRGFWQHYRTVMGAST